MAFAVECLVPAKIGFLQMVLVLSDGKIDPHLTEGIEELTILNEYHPALQKLSQKYHNQLRIGTFLWIKLDKVALIVSSLDPTLLLCELCMFIVLDC